MTNKLQITTIIFLIVVAGSVFYSLVVRPIQKDKKLYDCLSTTYSSNKTAQAQVNWAEMCVKQYK